MTKLGEVIHLNNDSKNILRQIIKPELRRMLEITYNIYAGMPIPDKNNYQTLLDMKKDRWLRCSAITSRQIRLLIREAELITETKLITLTQDEAAALCKNINRLRSTQNKTKMLRLIHGDVYCGERLKKFKMSEIDTCIRYFEKETIKHLLVECPYTKEIWNLLGINSNDTKNVIGTHHTKE
jgi:zinc-binding in reverse transcriptase